MDDAFNTTDEVEKISTKIAATDSISHGDAKDIQKSTENVEKAVTNGDHKIAVDYAQNIQDRVEDIYAQKPRS